MKRILGSSDPKSLFQALWLLISRHDFSEGAPRKLRNVFGFGLIDEFFEQHVGLQIKIPGHTAMAFYKTPGEVEYNSRFRPKIMDLFCIAMSPTVALATLCFPERAAASMTGAERKLTLAARIIAVYIEHFFNKSGRLICEAMVRDWNMEDIEMDWQQPAFAVKPEPESPHTALFQTSTFPPSSASKTDVSKS